MKFGLTHSAISTPVALLHRPEDALEGLRRKTGSVLREFLRETRYEKLRERDMPEHARGRRDIDVARFFEKSRAHPLAEQQRCQAVDVDAEGLADRLEVERKACAFPILSKKGWGQAGRT